MTISIFWMVLILILTAIATAILGVFLVLRRMSMMIDAISHTVLLGIVLAFMFTDSLTSPLLMLGATLMGVITVFITEVIIKTKRTSEDSAIGLVFPLLFSIAVLIISGKFSNVHLDIDAVLLGKIELAPFFRLVIGGIDFGPKLLYIMLGVLIISIIFIKVFFKELKLISFDAALAATLGFAPFIIHYLLMSLVSLTAVAAFNAVGSILVVALMIGPPATAIMITKDLKKTLFIAPLIGVINSVVGFGLAVVLDVNISGMIATITLVSFLLVLVGEPRNGIIRVLLKRAKQKREFAFIILALHVNNHYERKEIAYDNIQYELNWSTSKYQKQIKRGLNANYFHIEDQCVYLTSQGQDFIDKQIIEFNI